MSLRSRFMSPQASWLRKTLLLILLAFASLGFLFGVERQDLSCAPLRQWVISWGTWGPIYFTLLYTAATLGLMPGMILSLLAGEIYGLFLGTLLVVVGATLGATLVFLLARFLFRDRVLRYVSRAAWFAEFQERMATEGFHYLVFMRLVPLFPFGGINIASALLPMSVRTYFTASLLGMIPGSFAYVYFGAAGCQIIDALASDWHNIFNLPPEPLRNLSFALMLLAALSLLPIYLKRRRRRP